MITAKKQPVQSTSMVCGYCSTGCSLSVELRDGEPVGIAPNPDYSVNRGSACPKGWESMTPMQAKDRATTPLMRDARGRLVDAGWDDALIAFAREFKAIQDKHGPESVAFLGTGQITCEELAFLGALTKFGMGLVHGDGNTRQCMATAVTAYKQSFGFDAPPYTYQDFEESDVIVLVGSNLCIAHPIMWERICRNPHDPNIIVIDPRKTETAMAASHHLALRPKSDLVLFYAVANHLVTTGQVDREFLAGHTTGFEEFEQHVEQFPPELAAQVTVLGIEQIHDLADAIGSGERVSLWWTMGVNQSHEGTRVAQAIINLALMTGNIGRPGTGANSITGQCNAMGSRLFSNTSSLFGGRDFADPADRAHVAELLDINVDRIPSETGMAYDQIVEGILDGRIKGLWIIATNSAHSWINQLDFNDVLERLDFLVVQDLYADTETAARADLFLPAAGWGEKDGTFINSERRIGLVKKVHRAPGDALADFHIFQAIAHYWGCEDMFRDWKSPESVFALLAELSRGRACDFSGIEGYEHLERAGGVQWPYPELGADDAVERRLFADGTFFYPDGRARLLFEQPREVPEPVSSRYPFVLLTGRGSSSQWHTQTRTKRSPVLRVLYPADGYAEINPVDARARKIASNDRVIVSSRRGSIEVRAFVTHTVQPGQVFIPMHYDVTNQLTFPAFDPYSRQPAYKACAVDIRRRESWEG